MTRDGAPLPPRLRRELSRELDRLELMLEQLAEVEAERDAIVPDRASCDEAMALIAQLMRLRGVGARVGDHHAREVFYRDFANRKAVASYAGLTPSPYMSGTLQRDQGISKVGHRSVRTAMIELAWAVAAPSAGQRAQPTVLRPRRQHQGGLLRRIAVVGLARKLLVALWRSVTTDLIPTGATLKPA